MEDYKKLAEQLKFDEYEKIIANSKSENEQLDDKKKKEENRWTDESLQKDFDELNVKYSFSSPILKGRVVGLTLLESGSIVLSQRSYFLMREQGKKYKPTNII